MNGVSVYSAKLVRSGWLTRVFRIETGAGSYELEYQGNRIGEWVLVDGVRVGRGSIWCTSMVAPHIDFRLGRAPLHAEIDVRVWPWLMMRSFRLVVGGKVLYTEGRVHDFQRDQLLEWRTEVKLLERRLLRARAREADWNGKVMLAERSADATLHERCHAEFETIQSETRRLEAELKCARLALRVRE